MDVVHELAYIFYKQIFEIDCPSQSLVNFKRCLFLLNQNPFCLSVFSDATYLKLMDRTFVNIQF